MARLHRESRQISVDAELAPAASVNAGDTEIVQGLARGLTTLRAFRPEDVELSNIEISARVGLPRSTVSRLCKTLMRLGYLNYSPVTGNYSLGSGILALARSLLDNMSNRIPATPAMKILAEQVKLPVSLGIRDQDVILYLETVSHAEARPARFGLGTRLPIASTAMGRAHLAGLPENEAQALIRILQEEYPEKNWPALQPAIIKARTDVEQLGYCFTYEEWQTNVVGIACPIRLQDGGLLTINCGGTTEEISMQRIHEEIGPLLVKTAQEIVRVSGASTG